MQKYIPISGKIGFVLPVLTGCFTVLSMFSVQAFRLEWAILPMPLAIATATGLIMWLIFYILPLTRTASSVIASVATLMVMLWMTFPYPIMPVMIILSTIVVLYDLPKRTNQIIATFSLCIIAISVFVSLGWAGYNKIYSISNNPTQTSLQLSRTPDIYFIVPDRFNSPKGLNEFGLDSTWFVSELEGRGFYVPYDNISLDAMKSDKRELLATTRTLRFMASVLNQGIDIDIATPYNHLSNLVKYHSVGSILKGNGYVYHHIGDWWQETLSNPQADCNYIYHGYSILDYLSGNELAMAVVDRSWLRDINVGSLLPKDTLFRINKERNIYQLNTFCEIARENCNQPKFVFIHVLLPHPPYIWEANESNTANSPYLKQTEFTMGYLLEMIDNIDNLEDSIVIIQSDEGAAFPEPSDNAELSNDQWNGTLSAWHIPDTTSRELEDIQITEILGYVINEKL